MKNLIIPVLVFAATAAYSTTTIAAEERTLIGSFPLDDLKMDSAQIDLQHVRIGDSGSLDTVKIDLDIPFTKEQSRMMQDRILKNKSGKRNDVLLKISALVETDNLTKATNGRIIAFRAKEGAEQIGKQAKGNPRHWQDEGFIRLEADAKRLAHTQDAPLDNRQLHQLRRDLGDGEAAYGIKGIELKATVELHIRQENSVWCTVLKIDKDKPWGCRAHLVSLPPGIAKTLKDGAHYELTGIIAEDELCYGAFWVHAKSLTKIEHASPASSR